MTLDSDCCRLERYKYALYTKFKEPRLYRLAAKGNWGPIPQRCQSHSKEAEFIHRYAPSDTALHQILRFPSLELGDTESSKMMETTKENAIESLIATYPAITSIKDSFGRMPLHLACMNIETCGQVSFDQILKAYPQAASHQDMEGRSPLHYLLARNDIIPEGILSKLVVTCPAALEMRDLVKETPIDLVESRRDEIENADLILKQLQVMASAGTVSSDAAGATPIS